MLQTERYSRCFDRSKLNFPQKNHTMVIKHRSWHIQMLRVTLQKAVVFAGYSGLLQNLHTPSHDIWLNVVKKISEFFKF